jgi:hypothetical protein
MVFKNRFRAFHQFQQSVAALPAGRNPAMGLPGISCGGVQNASAVSSAAFSFKILR